MSFVLVAHRSRTVATQMNPRCRRDPDRLRWSAFIVHGSSRQSDRNVYRQYFTTYRRRFSNTYLKYLSIIDAMNHEIKSLGYSLAIHYQPTFFDKKIYDSISRCWNKKLKQTIERRLSNEKTTIT
jgi:hypothetical protein